MKSGKLAAAGGAFQVKKFTEKPNEVAAKKLIRQGSLWNSGIFVWKASLLLGSVESLSAGNRRGA